MTKKRIAIVGLGMASMPHAKSLLDLKDRVDVVAAFSPTERRRQAFSQTYGFPVCEDVEMIFSDQSVDAVMILTPPNTHLDLVRRAAAKGKHVLLEKPLEISLERSTALVTLMEKASLKLGIVLQHRFRPTSVALTDIMGSGQLGELVSASARLYNWRPQSYYNQPGRGTKARDGGGVLLTQAIHTLDLLVSLTGLPVEVIAYATTSPVHRMETEDLVMGALKFGNGAIGSVSATTCAFPGFPDEVDIVGTRGMARLNGTRLSAQFHDGNDFSLSDNAAGGTGANPMDFSHEHHRAVLDDFLDAITFDRAPKVTGHGALAAHQLIEAILCSSKTGVATQIE